MRRLPITTPLAPKVDSRTRTLSASDADVHDLAERLIIEARLAVQGRCRSGWLQRVAPSPYPMFVPIAFVGLVVLRAGWTL